MIFFPNPNFGRAFADDPDTRRGLVERAERAKVHAEVISPVRSGDYRDSFLVSDVAEGVYLGNTDWKAHWVEWGTAALSPQGVLRRSVTSIGLRFEGERG